MWSQVLFSFEWNVSWTAHCSCTRCVHNLSNLISCEWCAVMPQRHPLYTHSKLGVRWNYWEFRRPSQVAFALATQGQDRWNARPNAAEKSKLMAMWSHSNRPWKKNKSKGQTWSVGRTVSSVSRSESVARLFPEGLPTSSSLPPILYPVKQRHKGNWWKEPATEQLSSFLL